MELFEPADHHEMPLWKLISAVLSNGGTVSSTIVFESEGEPVYIEMVEDGNAFSVMAIVSKALRWNGHSDKVDEFMTEAMSGDYNHLLQTAMKWVNVE